MVKVDLTLHWYMRAFSFQKSRLTNRTCSTDAFVKLDVIAFHVNELFLDEPLKAEAQ